MANLIEREERSLSVSTDNPNPVLEIVQLNIVLRAAYVIGVDIYRVDQYLSSKCGGWTYPLQQTSNRAGLCSQAVGKY
jgi:hypothetical protein